LPALDEGSGQQAVAAGEVAVQRSCADTCAFGDVVEGGVHTVLSERLAGDAHDVVVVALGIRSQRPVPGEDLACHWVPFEEIHFIVIDKAETLSVLLITQEESLSD
jgi:hypothetical protein